MNRRELKSAEKRLNTLVKEESEKNESKVTPKVIQTIDITRNSFFSGDIGTKEGFDRLYEARRNTNIC